MRIGASLTFLFLFLAPFVVLGGQAVSEACTGETGIWDCVYQFIKDFQTLLAAAFVILTVRATYNIDRQRRGERADKNRSLARALTAETLLLAVELETVFFTLDRYKKRKTPNELETAVNLLNSFPESVIYGPDNLEIFHLPSVIVQRVIEFHFDVDQISDRFGHLNKWEVAPADGGVERLQQRLLNAVETANLLREETVREFGDGRSLRRAINEDRLRSML